MAARLFSGTMLPFIVPIIGKYIPTHTSNIFIPMKETVSLIWRATKSIAIEPTAKIPTPNFSTENCPTRILNNEEPVIQNTMKVEKITP